VISFLVVMVLFVAAMWGFSMAVGAIGVAIRNGNQLSNLLFSPILLVAGTMYPVDRMPDWLRIAARCLPFSYGMESLVASLTTNASVVDLADSLVPLAGFAIVLPLIGIAAFTRLERMSKNTGSLELM
jgi:ABC-2 type transport system permease protein